VEVFGVPTDCHKQNTLVIPDNGFNPRWDEELSFTITCPELALVMFRVVDEEKTRSDVTVAHYCLPFECMQTGYRMVALRDRHGNIVGDTSLFIHVRVEQSVESTAL
jgi:C2 domain